MYMGTRWRTAPIFSDWLCLLTFSNHSPLSRIRRASYSTRFARPNLCYIHLFPLFKIYTSSISIHLHIVASKSDSRTFLSFILTKQAAVASIPLSLIQSQPSPNLEDIARAYTVLTILILSIFITAAPSAFAIEYLGVRVLDKEDDDCCDLSVPEAIEIDAVVW